MNNENVINLKPKGYYSLAVLDANGNRKEEKCINHIDNEITYNGAYQVLFQDRGYYYWYCKVGTGTTPITRSSSGLTSPLVTESNVRGWPARETPGHETDNGDGTSTLLHERTYTFGLGAIVGNISEVGIFVYQRDVFIAGQLIKDEFGNPTTVTLLADEQLVVTYTTKWTVLNEARFAGSGSVTAEDGTVYSYNVYAQPYFFKQTPNTDSETVRWDVTLSFADEVAFRGSNGSTVLYDTGDLGASGYGASWADFNNGIITITSRTYTFPPATFSSSDIAFVGFQESSSRRGSVNTSTFLMSNSYYAFLIHFTPTPLVKTANDTLTIGGAFVQFQI